MSASVPVVGLRDIILQTRETEQVGIEPVLAYTVLISVFITAVLVGYYLGIQYIR